MIDILFLSKYKDLTSNYIKSVLNTNLGIILLNKNKFNYINENNFISKLNETNLENKLIVYTPDNKKGYFNSGCFNDILNTICPKIDINLCIVLKQIGQQEYDFIFNPNKIILGKVYSLLEISNITNLTIDEIMNSCGVIVNAKILETYLYNRNEFDLNIEHFTCQLSNTEWLFFDKEWDDLSD